VWRVFVFACMGLVYMSFVCGACLCLPVRGWCMCGSCVARVCVCLYGVGVYVVRVSVRVLSSLVFGV